MEILRTRLRKAREARKLSQSFLARCAGCGQEKISFYETGKSKPQYQTLVRLADALQVSIDYLLGRTDTMSPKMSLEDVLEKDEIDLILKYRSLSKEKKIKLSGIVIGLGE